MTRPQLPGRLVPLVLLSVIPVAAAAVCDGVSPTSGTGLSSVVVASGMTNKPLYVAAPPGDVNRIFIVEQVGFVRIHKRGDPATTIATYLDIHSKVYAAGNELGLLGLAFDPNYATNGYFYVNYTELVSAQIYTVIARYKVSANPDAADPASELRILRLAQPESNHNGGQLLFGQDRFLYVFTGDGGGGGDLHGTCGNGQNTGVLLGKILRLDVDNVDPQNRAPDCGGASGNYRVPSTNPFIGTVGACDEIWAYGLRNPWRDSQDTSNGDWYVGDVGQNCWEELDYVTAATAAKRNYGWRQMEGKHCFDHTNQGNCNPTSTPDCSPPCNAPSLTLPVLDYGHSGGACAIIGGYAYRGCKMPDMAGTYFYGDNCAGFVKTLKMINGQVSNQLDRTADVDPAGNLVGNLTSFGVDGRNEIYIAVQSGSVKLILPPFPALEVSAPGAADMLRLSKTQPWTWENLAYTTQSPVSYYKVYRGVPKGTFICVYRAATNSWTGDPAVPVPGTQYAYLVTAVNASGQETSAGSPPRTLSPAACP